MFTFKLFTMGNSITLLIVCCLYVSPLIAQERLITCSSQRNADNSISIISESQAFGDYTVKITFTELNNYTTSSAVISNIALATVGHGRSELLKLQNKLASAAAFQYRYTYYPGRALRKTPDSSFVYLLPATPGNSVRISQASSLAAKLGQAKSNDYSATGFVYKLGDTISASRAGLVYACNDDILEGEKTADFYKSDRNKIHIQHNDGSLSTYDILAPIHLLVSAGENIYPGKPIAVFNKQSEKYTVLLSIYYLDEKKLYSTNDAAIPPLSNFIYMPAHFYTGENSTTGNLQINNLYLVQHPKEIVTAELSKREKKKWGFL